ncbi:hypothetical protein BO99DRAFT_399825 [Aspergillus violaceofuscus CBS 115571]|uniref:C6 finger domain protein n=1 Tax=Aspergillus violaceofuscus (strain CBS 115571) TaxID=1450538 RepID=A0A2V5HJR2_ASPV1|nr:hypothetical protein BO99DRAFT_399825 [Aspergillus violaceofuscus CBS 115571]
MLHAELLCHLLTETLSSLSAANGGHPMAIPWPEMVGAPYLLNELLALAATHLSIIRPPTQRTWYRYHAKQLQTHAVRSFQTTTTTGEKATDPAASTPARFLFSSILGLHMLCETLIFREGNFTVFFDAFIHYLRLQQGVRAVIGGQWRALTMNPRFGPALGAAEAQLQQGSPRDESGSYSHHHDEHNLLLERACNDLLTRIGQAKLGAAVTATHRHAIEALQLAVHASASFPSSESSSSSVPYPGVTSTIGVFAWPASISTGFIDLLALRSPDALVVLAHYGVLLHAHRRQWFLSDGGQYLIESIRVYLGPDWSEWMAFSSQSLGEG